MQPAIEDTLDNLARHGHLAGVDPVVIEQVRAMSAATMDRRLAPARTGLVAGKGLAHILWRVACAGEGLPEAEKALDWPARSGKLVLKLALERVADFYRVG